MVFAWKLTCPIISANFAKIVANWKSFILGIECRRKAVVMLHVTQGSSANFYPLSSWLKMILVGKSLGFTEHSFWYMAVSIMQSGRQSASHAEPQFLQQEKYY